MYISKKMKLFVLVMIVTILTGCGGGGGSTDSSYANINEGSSTAKTIHEGQVKDSPTGNGLADVKVSIGESTVTTDKNGFYKFSDLKTSEEAVVNFKKEGYFLGSTLILLKPLSKDDTVSPNYLEYTMHTYNRQWNYDRTEEMSDTNININTSVIYIDSERNPYHGTITAELTILDITSDEGKVVFPGAFKGINTHGTMVQFDSYGLISISFKDSNDNILSFEDGGTVTLTFDTVDSLEEQNIIPLWYYDYTQGLWFEEGYAERQTDGTYRGDISHPGTWSLNKPIESDPGIFRAHIVDENGSPVGDVRVHAIGSNWVSSDLSTNEDGLFELEVIPGKDFHLTAYNYKDKYGATYNFIIPAIASGDIVED